MFKKINKILILVLLLSIVFSSLAFADALYPHVNTVTQSDGSLYPYSFVFIRNSNKPLLAVGTSPFVNKPLPEVGDYIFNGELYFTSSNRFYIYVIDSDDFKWRLANTMPPGQNFRNTITSLSHTSHDILWDNGTVFFSKPTIQLDQVVKEETGIMMTDLVGKILTILPVGFGLLSGILLVMLFRRFYRLFLHR